MKKNKCILLFDDKDQKNIINSIKISTKQDFDLDFVFIRTSTPDLKKDDSEDLDVEKLEEKIKSSIQNKHIDIALTDFDLECDYLNGLDVVRMVHKYRPKVNFFIYSGNWNKVIENVIGAEYKNALIEQLVGGINKLIHDKIIDCVDRVDYKQDLINYLKEDNKESMEHRLCVLLRNNGDMIFNSCFPEFNGKTFNEIADIIENGSDARSDEWIEAILSQTIAYLAEVNK